MRIYLAVFASLFVFNPLFASDFFYTTIKNPSSIRAQGMGNTFTGIAEGLDAITFNPAGLSLPGIGYYYGNLDQDNTLTKSNILQGLYLQSFGYQNHVIKDKNDNKITLNTFGWGSPISNAINWGITYKTIASTIATEKNNAWSTDLGLLVRILPNLNLGIVAQDIHQKNLHLPTTIRTGTAWYPFHNDILLTSDIVYQENGKKQVKTSLGTEFPITYGLSLRTGINDDQISYGTSLRFSGFTLDAAVQNKTYLLGITLGPGPLLSQQNKRKYALFKPSAYAVFSLAGDLVEGRSEISLFGGEKIGTNDLIPLLHAAILDPTCEGLIVRIGGLSSNLSSIGLIQEIRSELLLAKSKGKKVYAYIEYWATLPEYYLASAATSIVMPELASISHLGLQLEVTKTKNFLNKFGFDSTVVANGTYKNALHPTSPTLNDTQRIGLEDLINTLYKQALFDIKESRNLNWKSVSDCFDGRIISSSDALEKGLIDKIGYYDTLEKLSGISEKIPTRSKVLPLETFAHPQSNPSLFSPNNRIAIIEIDGAIGLGSSQTQWLFGGKSTGSDTIESICKYIIKDRSYKGVILRINSGGGSMLASDKIYHAIDELRKEGIKVYTSMGNIAASGGYYIALNSDKIFANSGTLTGSIGIISVFDNMEKFNTMLGINKDIIKTGKYTDMMTNSRPLTPEELQMLKDNQNTNYALFLKRVMDHRHLTKEEALQVAQGQTIPGQTALTLKLIDHIGTFEDTIQALAKDTNIQETPELRYFRNQPTPLWSILQKQIF
jgi:protease-4